MKRQKLIKMLKLSDKDFDRIRVAVQEAEQKTNGEIALAATSESSDYSFYELFLSVALGAIVFTLLLPLSGTIQAMLNQLFWHPSEWYLAAFYGIASFGSIALFFLFANIPAIDRKIIPRAVRAKAVYNRALRHFVESGVYATKDRTGILILLSYMEHEVRIIADAGVNQKVSQSEWDVIAHSIATGIKEGKTADALVDAVKKCGDILETHFKAKKENPNELSDGLFLLEAGE